jgi:hypothetical protein
MIEGTMEYQHTQKGPIYLALLAIAALLGINAWLFREQWLSFALLSGGAVLFGLLALSFRQLTVKDHGQGLAVRFGPLPLFRTQIPYASITAVEAGRSSLIDGLGIHFVPGRGWTYNLWGADCVVAHLGDRLIRIGTNDVDGLLVFLRGKIQGDK